MGELEAVTRIRRIIEGADRDRAIAFPDPRRWIDTDTVKQLLNEYDRLREERDSVAFGPVIR